MAAMTDLLENLIEQIKNELLEISKEFDEDASQSFYGWMNVEYKNYMMIQKTTCIDTLNKLEAKYNEYKPLIDILRNHINDYGSLQAFYRVSIDLKNKS